MRDSQKKIKFNYCLFFSGWIRKRLDGISSHTVVVFPRCPYSSEENWVIIFFVHNKCKKNQLKPYRNTMMRVPEIYEHTQKIRIEKHAITTQYRTSTTLTRYNRRHELSTSLHTILFLQACTPKKRSRPYDKILCTQLSFIKSMKNRLSRAVLIFFSLSWKNNMNSSHLFFCLQILTDRSSLHCIIQICLTFKYHSNSFR